MGLTSADQRAELLRIAQLAAKQTSFARQLAQAPTLISRQRSQQSSIQDLAGLGFRLSIGELRPPLVELTAAQSKGLIADLDQRGFSMPGLKD